MRQRSTNFRRHVRRSSSSTFGRRGEGQDRRFVDIQKPHCTCRRISPKLCLGWARVGAFLAPTGSHGKLGWRRTNDFISALSEAAGCSEFQTAETAKRHTGESRTGEAARGRDPLREAARFIKEHPVVFGQFTKEDIDRLEFKRQNLKTNQTTC